MPQTMRELLDHYGSNKGDTYGDLYDELLTPIRFQVRWLIEIGIGTLVPDAISTMHGYAKHDRYKPGGSLRAFRDFLPNAHVYGIDTQDDTQFAEDRLVTVQIDSTRVKMMGINADVIIDDGDHSPQAQLATFKNFWHLLNDGGLYVIEDVLPETQDVVLAGLPKVPVSVVYSTSRWLALVLRKAPVPV